MLGEVLCLAMHGAISGGMRRRGSAWNASTSGDGLERPEEVCNRVRRKLTAARVQGGLTWEELFHQCDRDRSETMDFKEFKYMVRDMLHVPEQTVCEYDLHVLFQAADEDHSEKIDVVELLKYLQHGPRRAEDEAARLQLRMERIRRNMQMAFSRLDHNELQLRRLFQKVDVDDSQRLTRNEFNNFVRKDLSLSRWHVMNDDLERFYRQMDRDGDGVDVKEFLTYVRQAGKVGRQTSSLTSLAPPPSAVHERRKRRTYREELQECLARSESAPRLRDAVFCSQGRDRPAASRHAISLAGMAH